MGGILQHLGLLNSHNSWHRGELRVGSMKGLSEFRKLPQRWHRHAESWVKALGPKGLGQDTRKSQNMSSLRILGFMRTATSGGAD